jgi:hypothetical protein
MGNVCLKIGPLCRLSQDAPLWLPHAINAWAREQHQVSFFIEISASASFAFLMPAQLEKNVRIEMVKSHNRHLPGWKRWLGFGRKSQSQFVATIGFSTFGPASVELLSIYFDQSKKSYLTNPRRFSANRPLLVTYKWQKEQLLYKGCPQSIIHMSGLYVPTAEGQPSFAAQERWKQENTGGQEYLLCLVEAFGLLDFVALLTAFGQLKKWQRTGMKMVILGSLKKEATIYERLASYRHREDVVLLPLRSATQIMEWATHAYAVFAAPGFVNGSLAVRSVQLGVPVVSEANPVLDELFQRNYFKLAAWNAEHLSQTMLMVFKDEALRASTTAAAKAACWPLRENALPEALNNAYLQWAKPN